MRFDVRCFLGIARLAGLNESELEAVRKALEAIRPVEKIIEEISSWGLKIMRVGDAKSQLQSNLGISVDSRHECKVVSGDEQLLEYSKKGWTTMKELDYALAYSS